ncbi:histidine phosphatase family protein [Piscinibacter sp. HJYY11]|uniref:histidine phosphatase family protein n=1 Tax=Piscinibacter sp. HJYY11 TaxID=2801333 RepID=UPI00191FD9DE|nr:histidine phosphatase family protein [Piscinibacter sp. HJYY11]MBL0728399.1 histidine phosphatase family protein [Piscinibacter sp. HJYY11]
MSIILVRHGETPLNVARTLQPADTPLSETGLRQAQAVAQRLAGLQIAAILSSDLPRAMQTAQAIAAATGAPITFTPLLHERNFGDLRGQPYDSLPYNPLTMTDAPPGGESVAAFEQRVAQAFAQMVALRGQVEGHLAVVTHGLVIRALLARHLSLGADALPLRVGNTSVTICGATPPHTLELVDCTRHLDAQIAHDAQSLSGG